MEKKQMMFRRTRDDGRQLLFLFLFMLTKDAGETEKTSEYVAP